MHSVIRGSYGEEKKDPYVLFLRRIQWGCLNSFVTSYKQSLYNYYNCILKNTLQCIQDLTDYNSHHMTIKYFCGAISSKDIVDHPDTVWTIYSAANVNIYIVEFSMKHSDWKCDDEYLILKSKAQITTNYRRDTYTFCGERFPWQMTLRGSIIDIMFHKSVDNSHGYFGLNFHTTKSIPTKISYDGNVKNLDYFWYRYKRYSLCSVSTTEKNCVHILSPHKTTIMKVWWYIVADVVCFDGPGRNSPLIKQHLQADSSAYQLYCEIATNNPLFSLEYSLKHLKFLDGHAKMIPREVKGLQVNFSLSIDMNSQESNVFYLLSVDIYKSLRKGVEWYNHQYFETWGTETKVMYKLTITKLKGIPTQMLMDKKPCPYGGMSIYTENKNHNFVIIDTEITHQCSEDDVINFPIYLEGNNPRILFVAFKGYTTGFVQFEGQIDIKLDHKMIPSNDIFKVPFPIRKSILLLDVYKRFVKTFVLQPNHFINKHAHNYVIRFRYSKNTKQKFPVTARVTFIHHVNKLEQCVQCYVKTAHNSDFLDFFEGLIDPSLSEKTGKLIASVESIHINQRPCKIHHPWVLLIRAFQPYELTLNAANISLVLPSNTVIRNVELFDEYTWFMLSGIEPGAPHEDIIDVVTLHLTCLTTDVYVEHMILHKTSTHHTSTLYKWMDTSQSVWLQNLEHINIILISDRNKIVAGDSCRNMTRGTEVIEFKPQSPFYQTIFEDRDINRERNLHGFGLR